MHKRWDHFGEFVNSLENPVCLGRASSGVSSGGRELAVGVLADYLAPTQITVVMDNGRVYCDMKHISQY